MNDVTIVSTALFTIKIFVLIGLVLYTGFAAIVVRQEQLMADVLEEATEPLLRLFVRLHLLGAAILILLAAISL